MSELGIGQDYTVAVTTRDGYTNIGLLDVNRITWGRVLDDSSEATFQVGLAGGTPACCALAKSLRTWGHQVRISRDGTLVWEGPIIDLQYGRGNLDIVARDVTVWLARRRIRQILDFTKGADLSEIARALIEHGFQPDDPNVLAYLSIQESGVSGERNYLPDEPTYILDHLNELARTGLDYTVIGRRIAVFSEVSTSSLPMLRQDDFLDELVVREDGLAGATYANVRGSGVVGEYGGSHEFYGLLERVISEDNILDVPTANLRAQATVEAGNPVPLYVTTPGPARLACTAPVEINQLIPGMLVPITLDEGEVCRAVSTMMRLLSVDVTVIAGEEIVNVELGLPGTMGGQ